MARKYIYPRDLYKASLWYLALLQEIGKGASLDQIMLMVRSDTLGQANTSRRAVQLKLHKLQQAGLVKKTGSHKTAFYSISHSGVERLAKINFRDNAYTLPWDGQWRLVLFDIPETKKEYRYQIRRLLKDLGFKQLQLSAWIHPFPLLDQFHDIERAYGKSRDLQLLEVINFNPPQDITNFFQKQYPEQMRIKL